jgi:hypothetical protein
MVSWQPHPLVVSFLKMKTIINFLEAVVWNTMKGEVKEKTPWTGRPGEKVKLILVFISSTPINTAMDARPVFPLMARRVAFQAEG